MLILQFCMKKAGAVERLAINAPLRQTVHLEDLHVKRSQLFQLLEKRPMTAQHVPYFREPSAIIGKTFPFKAQLSNPDASVHYSQFDARHDSHCNDKPIKMEHHSSKCTRFFSIFQTSAFNGPSG